MNILILDSFSLNSGDEAILISTIRELNRVFKKPTISIEVSHPIVTHMNSSLSAYRKFPRIIDIQKLFVTKMNIEVMRSLMLGLFDYGCFLLWSILSIFGIHSMWCIRSERRKYASAIREADIIISIGGGFLNENYNYFLRFLTYILILIHGKPLHFMAQSIGPFSNKAAMLVMKYFLKKARTVSVREQESYQYLNTIGISKHVLTADIANLLTKYITPAPAKNNRKVVAICLKNNHKKNEEDFFEKSISNFISERIKCGYSIVLTCHTITDNDMAKRLLRKFGNNVTAMYFRSDPFKLKQLYKQCSFVVAARMHAIIFCSCVSVPFIAITYEPKFYGLMRQLRYDKLLVVPYQKATGDTLIRMAKYIEANRNRLRDQMEIVRKEQYKIALRTIEHIYESSIAMKQ